MSLRIELSGEFVGLVKEALVPSEWYLGFPCRHCNNQLAILPDPAGDGSTVVEGMASLSVTCRLCGKAGLYPASSVRAFQATTGGPFQPV